MTCLIKKGLRKLFLIYLLLKTLKVLLVQGLKVWKVQKLF